ncbi:MAG: ABC transporter permease, partial [Dermatophilaceae bacterium]
ILLLIVVALSLLAPVLTPYNPVEIIAGDRLQPPSAEHWFGTDSFGHDIYTPRALRRADFAGVGIIAVGIATLLGVTSGMLAGYFGGWTDSVIMRTADITLAFSGILLALVVIAVLGQDLFNAMIAVGIAAAPTYARVARGMVLKVKNEPYIESAICVGTTGAQRAAAPHPAQHSRFAGGGGDVGRGRRHHCQAPRSASWGWAPSRRRRNGG